MLAVLFCIALIPMIGLAIDGTNVYMMRNQIATALNAAVLAGNRSLNLGADIMTQENNAQNVAMNTFNANTANMYSNVKMNVNASRLTVIQNPHNHDDHRQRFGDSDFAADADGDDGSDRALVHRIGDLDSAPREHHAGARQLRPYVWSSVDGPAECAGHRPWRVNGFLNAFVKGTDSIGLVTFTSAPYVFIPPARPMGYPTRIFRRPSPPNHNMSPQLYRHRHGCGTIRSLPATAESEPARST